MGLGSRLFGVSSAGVGFLEVALGFDYSTARRVRDHQTCSLQFRTKFFFCLKMGEWAEPTGTGASKDLV